MVQEFVENTQNYTRKEGLGLALLKESHIKHTWEKRRQKKLARLRACC